jgi:hypothetical protein
MAEELSVTTGRVRSVLIGTTRKETEYARIRLARDTGYFMDFDEPHVWQGLEGRWVTIWYATQLGEDGHVWRVVLDMLEDDDDPAA